MVDAATVALASAEIDLSDGDDIWPGRYNSGLVAGGFSASFALQMDAGMCFTLAIDYAILEYVEKRK